jgi:hypothetical protein
VTQLAVAADGTLAWIVDQQQPPISGATDPALLYARQAGGKLIELDQTPSATQLGAPAIAADRRTITWTHDAAPRSYSLAP